MATEIVCDKCKTKQLSTANNTALNIYAHPGWGKLTIGLVVQADIKADFAGGNLHIVNDLCPACILEMKLPVIENRIQTPTLDSILQDIVYDAISEIQDNG